MMFILGLIIGLFIGANVGLLVVSLIVAAGNTDLELSEHNNGFPQ